MRAGFLIGIGSGLAAALLFYSAGRGSPLFSAILLLLTPLPALLAGLGWGWLPAAAGAVAGSAMMAATAGPRQAVGYFLALGLPAAVTAYLAYLSRPSPADANAREWYPVGRLLAALAIYGGALPVLILPLIGGTYDILRGPMSELLRRISAQTAADLGLKQLTQAQVDGLAEVMVTVLPGALASYWLAIITVNLYLAGRIALASGRLGRDWPDLPGMSYPPAIPILLAAAIAATFFSGLVGVAGVSLMGSLAFAYLVAGLALMHFIARGRAPWLLWIVYGALLVFGPYAALVLALGGLAEPLLKLKRRLGPPPPVI